MGELMRQYWLPAAMSSELTADGDPLRLKLLGEKLIGFRDSSGKVGIMDHRCPHRCASLFFGRNEEGGIRCVYHGWKFDTDGNCLDMANVPPHQDFKHKVKAKSYKTAERNGLIWVFMGDQENVPELSELEATLLPEEEHKIEFVQREYNWLQGLEGEIDTSHGVPTSHKSEIEINREMPAGINVTLVEVNAECDWSTPVLRSVPASLILGSPKRPLVTECYRYG